MSNKKSEGGATSSGSHTIRGWLLFLAVTIAPIKLSVRCSFQTTLGATGMNSDAKAIKESSGTHFQKQKYGLSATGTFLLTCVVIEIKEIHRDFRTEALRSFNVLP